MTIVDFFVAGDPVPQGSVRAFTPKRGGRPILTSDNRGLKGWRNRIATEAQRASDSMTSGPVMVEAHFRLVRPKSRPRRDQWPDRKPDVDKLLRAVLDGLTGILIEDDNQVCSAVAFKTYATPGEQPGARIVLRPLWAEEAGDPHGTAIRLMEYARRASQTLEEGTGDGDGETTEIASGIRAVPALQVSGHATG